MHAHERHTFAWAARNESRMHFWLQIRHNFNQARATVNAFKELTSCLLLSPVCLNYTAKFEISNVDVMKGEENPFYLHSSSPTIQ